MSEKKRTTVTTIEIHEVWIIRKGLPEPADEAETFRPAEIVQPITVSTLSEANNSSETDAEEKL